MSEPPFLTRRTAAAAALAVAAAAGLTATSAHAVPRTVTAIGVVTKASPASRTIVVNDNGGDTSVRGRVLTVVVTKAARVSRNGSAANVAAVRVGDTANVVGTRDPRGRLITTEVAAIAPPQPDVSPVPVVGSAVPATSAGPLSITIRDFVFIAPAAVLPVNTLVLITNADGFAHTFTGTGYSTGAIAGGGSLGVTFTRPGTYRFYCAIHPFMNGVLDIR